MSAHKKDAHFIKHWKKQRYENTRQSTQITIACSKSAIETLERGVKYVNFEHIFDLFLVFLLLTLNKSMLTGQ